MVSKSSQRLKHIPSIRVMELVNFFMQRLSQKWLLSLEVEVLSMSAASYQCLARGNYHLEFLYIFTSGFRVDY